MMLMLNSAWGFLYPWALAIVPPALGALIIAYRRRGKGPRAIVSSTIFLQRLERRSAARSRLVLPWRFFFELLLLLILLAAGAGLFSEAAEQRLAVLIDNSFSMSAPAEHGLIAASRLQLAKQAAAEYIGGLASDSRVDLFVAAPELQSLTDGFVASARALIQLEAVDFTYAADNLDAQLRRLALRADFQRIAVFTDRTVSAPPGSGSSGLDQRIRVTSAAGDGSALGNIAVIDFTSAGDVLQSKNLSLQGRVASFSPFDVQVEAVLTGLSCGIDRRVIERQSFSLASKQLVELLFKRVPAGCAAFELEIIAEDQRQDLGRGDNVAFIVPGVSGRRMLLVGPLTPQKLRLDQIPAVDFVHRLPDHYSAAESEKFSAVLFHRFLPAALPAANVFVVYPQDSTTELHVGAEISGAKLTRWADSSPLLRYLELSALQLNEVRPLTVPDWGEEIISSTSGTIALTGELKGRRVAAVGYEIFPYLGKDTPLLSVFTLNVLKWLWAGSLQAGHSPVYSFVAAPGEVDDARYLGGSFVDIKRSAVSGIVPREPGIIEWRSGAQVVQLSAVNFFSPQESDFASSELIEIPVGGRRLEGALKHKLVTSTAALAVLIMLLLDLLLSGRKQLLQKRVMEEI